MKHQDSLSKELALWRIEPPRNPAFRPAVWSRLKAGSLETGLLQYMRQHVMLSACALAFSVSLGMYAGHLGASARSQRDRLVLADTYLASIDSMLVVDKAN
jgi:hypothetical protein